MCVACVYVSECICESRLSVCVSLCVYVCVSVCVSNDLAYSETASIFKTNPDCQLVPVALAS